MICPSRTAHRVRCGAAFPEDRHSLGTLATREAEFGGLRVSIEMTHSTLAFPVAGGRAVGHHFLAFITAGAKSTRVEAIRSVCERPWVTLLTFSLGVRDCAGLLDKLTWTTEFAAEVPRKVLIAPAVKVVLILSGGNF